MKKILFVLLGIAISLGFMACNEENFVATTVAITWDTDVDSTGLPTEVDVLDIADLKNKLAEIAKTAKAPDNMEFLEWRVAYPNGILGDLLSQRTNLSSGMIVQLELRDKAKTVSLIWPEGIDASGLSTSLKANTVSDLIQKLETEMASITVPSGKIFGEWKTVEQNSVKVSSLTDLTSGLLIQLTLEDEEPSKTLVTIQWPSGIDTSELATSLEVLTITDLLQQLETESQKAELPEDKMFDEWLVVGDNSVKLSSLTQLTDSLTISTSLTNKTKYATIEFVLNGGKILDNAGNEITSVQAPVGSVYNLRDPEERAGYVFDDWYTSENFSIPVYSANISREATFVFYAKWVKTFTVSFELSGGELPSGAPTYVAVREDSSNKSIILPAPLNRDGFVFNGWYQNGVKVGESGSTYTITKDTTLEAKWASAKRIINLELDEGIVNGITDGKIEVELDAEGLLPIPTKENYRFLGWFTSENFDENSLVTSYEKGSADTVYAKWLLTSRTITFVNLDEETEGVDGNKFIVNIDASGKFPTPEKENYVFLGWFTDSNFDLESKVEGYAPGSPNTVYSKWEGEERVITLNYTGGTFEEISEGEIVSKYGNLITTAPEEPIKENYVFEAWLDESGNAINFSEGYTVKDEQEIKASWVKAKRIINLHLNEGSIPGNENNTLIVDFDASGSLPIPIKENYRFDGWFSTPELFTSSEVTSYYEGSSANLYVRWIELYTIQFDTAGGEVTTGSIETKVIREDSPVKTMILPTLEKEGYIFKGWYEDGGIKAGDAGDEYTITSSNNLTALWMKLYSVKLDWNLATPKDSSYTLPLELWVESPEVLFALLTQEIEKANPPEGGAVFDQWRGQKVDGGFCKLMEVTKEIIEDGLTVRMTYTGYNNVHINWNGAVSSNQGELLPQSISFIQTDWTSSQLLQTKLDEILTTFDIIPSHGVWSMTKIDGSSANVDEITLADTTEGVIANWIELYTISFNLDGASQVSGNFTPDIIRADAAENTIILPNVEKEGSEFLGWYDGDVNVGFAGDEYTVEATKELVAKWSEIYEINLNWDGATGNNGTALFSSFTISEVDWVDPETSLIDVIENKLSELSISVSPENHVWDVTKNNGTTVSLEEITLSDVANGIMLNYIELYTIQFDTSGGNLPNDYEETMVMRKDGELSLVLPKPIKEGYVFAHWSFGENNLLDGTTHTISGNETLIAEWTAEKRVLIFDYAGGSLDSASQHSFQTEFGAILTQAPASPSKTNYAFDGWQDENGNIIDFEEGYNVTNNTTITAKWNPRPIIIQLNYQGGKLNEASMGIFNSHYNELLKTAPTPPEKENYEFKEWTNSDGTPINFSKGYLVTEETVFNATWTKAMRTIVFHPDGGRINGALSYIKIIDNTLTVDFDKEGQLSAITTYKANHIFRGWYTNPEFTGEKQVSYSEGSSANLYAKWVEAYRVTFDADGGLPVSGSSLNAITKGLDESLTITLPKVAKAGEIFLGWYDGDQKVGDGGQSYTLTGTKTLQAKWRTTHRITMNWNGEKMQDSSASLFETLTIMSDKWVNPAISIQGEADRIIDGLPKPLKSVKHTWTATKQDGSTVELDEITFEDVKAGITLNFIEIYVIALDLNLEGASWGTVENPIAEFRSDLPIAERTYTFEGKPTAPSQNFNLWKGGPFGIFLKQYVGETVIVNGSAVYKANWL